MNIQLAEVINVFFLLLFITCIDNSNLKVFREFQTIPEFIICISLVFTKFLETKFPFFSLRQHAVAFLNNPTFTRNKTLSVSSSFCSEFDQHNWCYFENLVMKCSHCRRSLFNLIKRTQIKVKCCICQVIFCDREITLNFF